MKITKQQLLEILNEINSVILYKDSNIAWRVEENKLPDYIEIKD